MGIAPRCSVLGFVVAAMCAAGCNGGPSYELRWTLGCSSGREPCAAASPRACASAGFGAVQVEARQGTSSSTQVFPCFGEEGPVGRGPGLSAGALRLSVLGLSPRGTALAVEPTVADATLPDEGSVTVEVDLQVPPACSDAIDNDGDRFVDTFDPDCDGASDDDEAANEAGTGDP